MQLIEQSFEYEHLTEEVKKSMLIEYLKDLEANHFSLALVEPSKLQEPQPYQQWKAQISQIEKQIVLVRSKYVNFFGAEEE
jgi:hypothetical protein